MKYSNLFFYNNHFDQSNTKYDLIQLMQKSCLVHQDSSGIYSTLSLGHILEKKIISVIEKTMEDAGFSQIRMSLLQDSNLWKKTNRLDSYGEELFKLKNRKNHMFCLSATGEELITSIYTDFYQRQNADCHIFQIGNKYRDEMRSRNGLTRAKEFLMKDGYSFCSNKEKLEEIYTKIKEAYLKIFKHFNLDVVVKKTDNGEMGGHSSEEFLVSSSLADNEEQLLEIGHIFNLGTFYSEKFNLVDDKQQFVNMACYGIGISRLMMLLLEKQRDNLGFFGTDNFNTFDFIVTAINYDKDEAVKQLSLDTYEILKKKGYTVLLDDRNCSAGKKLADSELICASNRIIISKQGIKNNTFELLLRKEMKKTIIDNIENIAILT